MCAVVSGGALGADSGANTDKKTGIKATLSKLQGEDQIVSVNLVATQPGQELPDLKPIEKYLNSRAAQFPNSDSRSQRVWLARQLRGDLFKSLQSQGFHAAVIKPPIVREGKPILYEVEPKCVARWQGFEISLWEPALGVQPQKLTPETVAGLKTNEPMNHDDYEAAAKKYLRKIQEEGWLWAEWHSKKVEVIAQRCQARVIWEIDRGHKARLVGYNIERNKALHQSTVRRAARLETNADITPLKLANARQTLLATEWFSELDLDLERVSEDSGDVMLAINYEMAKPNVYGAEAGYSSDRGAQLKLNWKRRWLPGNGNSLTADYRVSQIDQRYSVGYEIPINSESQISHVFSFAHEEKEFEGLATESDTFKWLWPQRRLGWLFTPGLSFQTELAETDLEENKTQMLLGLATLSRQWWDNPLWPRSGYFVEFSSAIGAQGVASEQDALRFDVEGSLLLDVAEDWTLLLRGGYGRVYADNVEELPTDLRFFAGGDNSVRGFDFNALAPEDASGDVIGGRERATATVEPTWYLRPGFGIATFVDVGGAWNSIPDELPWATGVGVRWRSPVGRIAADLAFGSNDGDSSVRFHLRLGLGY